MTDKAQLRRRKRKSSFILVWCKGSTFPKYLGRRVVHTSMTADRHMTITLAPPAPGQVPPEAAAANEAPNTAVAAALQGFLRAAPTRTAAAAYTPPSGPSTAGDSQAQHEQLQARGGDAFRAGAVGASTNLAVRPPAVSMTADGHITITLAPPAPGQVPEATAALAPNTAVAAALQGFLRAAPTRTAAAAHTLPSSPSTTGGSQTQRGQGGDAIRAGAVGASTDPAVRPPDVPQRSGVVPVGAQKRAGAGSAAGAMGQAAAAPPIPQLAAAPTRPRRLQQPRRVTRNSTTAARTLPFIFIQVPAAGNAAAPASTFTGGGGALGPQALLASSLANIAGAAAAHPGASAAAAAVPRVVTTSLPLLHQLGGSAAAAAAGATNAGETANMRPAALSGSARFMGSTGAADSRSSILSNTRALPLSAGGPTPVQPQLQPWQTQQASRAAMLLAEQQQQLVRAVQQNCCCSRCCNQPEGQVRAGIPAALLWAVLLFQLLYSWARATDA